MKEETNKRVNKHDSITKNAEFDEYLKKTKMANKLDCKEIENKVDQTNWWMDD